MPVIIGLLRGVNVGGSHLVPMQQLRDLCCSLGLQDVKTYLQSGNLIFSTKERNIDAAAKKLETALEQKFGFRVDVIVRTAEQLKDVIAANPFAKRREVAPNKLHVVFLGNELSTETKKAIAALQPDKEELRFGGRELYIYFPDGMGQSKFMPRVTRLLKNSGTARNWNTVTKLLEIAKEMQE